MFVSLALVVLVLVLVVLDVAVVVHLCCGVFIGESLGVVVRGSEKRHAPVRTVSLLLELGLTHSS